MNRLKLELTQLLQKSQQFLKELFDLEDNINKAKVIVYLLVIYVVVALTTNVLPKVI